jgi:hypothetical protein
MTRHDYCDKCGELVGNYDVKCNTCSISWCWCCISTYDNISRICALIACLNEQRNPSLSTDEIHQLYLDVIDMHATKQAKQIKKIKNSKLYDLDCDMLSELDVAKITKIVNTLSTEDYYKCHACYQLTA